MSTVGNSLHLRTDQGKDQGKDQGGNLGDGSCGFFRFKSGRPHSTHLKRNKIRTTRFGFV